MIGFLLYLCTVFKVSHYLYIIPFLILFIINIKKIDFNFSKIKLNYLIILFIVILSFINILLSKNNNLIDYIPYTLLMIAGYFIAEHIKKRDLQIIVLFIVLETLVAVVEYLLGINTIFYKSDIFRKYSSEALFYYTRTYGLSANSSIYALKLLMAILMIDYFNLFKSNIKNIIKIIILAGLVFSFSRTVLIVVLFYYILIFIIPVIKVFKNPYFKFSIKKYYNYFAVSLFVIAVIVSIDFYKKTFYTQITRGKSNIELSGREIIWPQFINKIKKDPIFGNHSKKFYADYHGVKNAIHGHNSFLQVLANNGVIIFVLFIVLLFINITKYNIIFILAIILYSMTQYGIFWGISLLDIFMFMLFIYNTDKKRLAIE